MAESKYLCLHSLYDNEKRKDWSFCMKCGCLCIINITKRPVYTCKTADQSFNFEVDPIVAWERIKNHSSSTKNKKDHNLAGYSSARKTVIYNLKRLIRKYGFNDEMFHLSLSFIDAIMKNFTQANSIPDTKLELLVISCFLLAVKFGANDPMVPDLNNFSSSSSSFYFNVKDVRKYEDFCIKALNYELSVQTAYSVLQFLINCGFLFEDEIASNSSSLDESDSSHSYNTEKAHTYAYKLITNFMCNSKSLDYSPLQIALAVIWQTRDHFGYDSERTDVLFQTVYGYDPQSSFVNDCLNTIRSEECFFSNKKVERQENLIKVNKILVNSEPTKQKSQTSKNILEICKDIETKLNFHLDKASKVSNSRKNSNSNLQNLPKDQYSSFSKKNSTSNTSTTSNSTSSRSTSKTNLLVRNYSKVHYSGRLPVVNKPPETILQTKNIPLLTKKSCFNLNSNPGVISQRNVSKSKNMK